MPDKVLMLQNESVERCVDLEEVNISNGTIKRRIEACRLCPEHEAILRHEPRQHLAIGEAASIGGVRLVAPYALVEITFGVVFARALPVWPRWCPLCAERNASRNCGQN